MAITVKIGLVCFAEPVTCTGKVFKVMKPRQTDLKLVLLWIAPAGKPLLVYLQSQGNKFMGWMLLSSSSFYLLGLSGFFFTALQSSLSFCRWHIHRSPQPSMLQRTVLSVSINFLLFQCLSKKHRKKKKTAINNPLGWPLHFLGILHSQGCVHQKNELSVPEEKALQQWRQRVSHVGISSLMRDGLIPATGSCCCWSLGS